MPVSYRSLQWQAKVIAKKRLKLKNRWSHQLVGTRKESNIDLWSRRRCNHRPRRGNERCTVRERWSGTGSSRRNTGWNLNINATEWCKVMQWVSVDISQWMIGQTGDFEPNTRSSQVICYSQLMRYTAILPIKMHASNAQRKGKVLHFSLFSPQNQRYVQGSRPRPVALEQQYTWCLALSTCAQSSQTDWVFLWLTVVLDCFGPFLCAVRGHSEDLDDHIGVCRVAFGRRSARSRQLLARDQLQMQHLNMQNTNEMSSKLVHILVKCQTLNGS